MEIKNDLKKMIYLNQLEFMLLAKKYFLMYFTSLIRDLNGEENRDILKEKIREYSNIIREENRYLGYLIKGLNQVRNEETFDRILDDLDFINEQTYRYYDSILYEYEENIFSHTLNRKIVRPKTFQTILENPTYWEEIIGLSLTSEDLDIYFGDQAGFSYLKENAKIFDVPLRQGMDLFGCYPLEDEKTEVLKSIKICVPEITDLNSMYVNIHEFKHGLDLYPYLGKKIPEKDYEKMAQEEEGKFKTTYFTKKLLKAR